MIEAKTQARDGLSVMTNVEKSYRYWLLHDRLLNSFHRKAVDEGDGSGEGVNDIGAFAADLWEIYQAHGFEILHVTAASKTSDVVYPNDKPYQNRFQANPNSDGLQDTALVLQTEQQLIHGTFTESEAESLIQQTLQKAFVVRDPMQTTTPWLNSAIPVAKTFETVLGLDFTGSHSVILLSSALSTELPTGQWFHYNSDRSLAIAYRDPKDILKIVRASIDRGWPTTFETVDHVMTALGYKTVGNSFVYAISNSSTAYTNKTGVIWVSEADALGYFTDATVYYDLVADLLPHPPALERPLPSKRLSRKN